MRDELEFRPGRLHLDISDLRMLAAARDCQIGTLGELTAAIGESASAAITALRRELGGRPLAIVFSAGVDSLLVALLALQQGLEPLLVSYADPAGSDYAAIEAFSTWTGLGSINVGAEPVTLGEFERALKAASSPALYTVAYQVMTTRLEQTIAAHGIEDIVEGTGADLLFAGGRRPEEFGDLHLPGFVRSYWEAVLPIWHWRYCFTASQASQASPRSWCPLETDAMLSVARAADPRLLWHDGHDKWPLRLLLEQLGCPPALAKRAKDPAQSSSGVFAEIEALMLAEIDADTDHRVSHRQREDDRFLLATRAWVALRAARHGIGPRPTSQPRAPLSWADLERELG